MVQVLNQKHNNKIKWPPGLPIDEENQPKDYRIATRTTEPIDEENQQLRTTEQPQGLDEENKPQRIRWETRQ